MSYKRLTNEELNDFTSRVVVQLEPTLTQQVMSLILELSEYRTKIENGTLIELPCKVGDKVYVIEQDWDNDYNYFYYIDEYKFTLDLFGNWGKTVFLTKAEAEQKLKELKGEV